MATGAVDLSVLTGDPLRSGVFVDFDGTLSEIAATPEAARPVEGAGEVLGSIAEVFAVVAVVSGRPAAQVARLLGRPSRVRVFGLYGLDHEGGPVDPAAEGLEARAGTILARIRRIASAVDGARVESKGLQVAVHYRGAADPDAARRTLLLDLEPIAQGAGFRVLEGKRVVELAPATGPTKGSVVDRLAREHRLRAVLYAGDDVADLQAFAAVDRLADAGVAGVKVAVRSAEAPSRLLEEADVVVSGPAGLATLLRDLLRD